MQFRFVSDTNIVITIAAETRAAAIENLAAIIRPDGHYATIEGCVFFINGIHFNYTIIEET